MSRQVTLLRPNVSGPSRTLDAVVEVPVMLTYLQSSPIEFIFMEPDAAVEYATQMLQAAVTCRTANARRRKETNGS